MKCLCGTKCIAITKSHPEYRLHLLHILTFLFFYVFCQYKVIFWCFYVSLSRRPSLCLSDLNISRKKTPEVLDMCCLFLLSHGLPPGCRSCCSIRRQQAGSYHQDQTTDTWDQSDAARTTNSLQPRLQHQRARWVSVLCGSGCLCTEWPSWWCRLLIDSVFL